MCGNFLKFAGLLLILAAVPWHAARADAATEAALRAALQNSTAQIAQLEDQVANLQASQAPDVAMIEALKAQLKAQGGGESPAVKSKNAAALSGLHAKVAALQAKLAQAQSDDAATHTQLSQLQLQLASTTASLGSCTAKNLKLVALSNQILDAYSHKDDVLSAFANHEPFTGLARVKLQNIVQDDQDKIDANTIDTSTSTP